MSQEQITVSIMRMPGTKGVPLPSYQTDHAAAMDIHAAVENPVIIPPGEVCAIPTGFAIALPSGYEAQIRPRSGLALKQGLTIPNTPATIDADYRGEVRVLLINHGTETFVVNRGMRIAQILVKPVPKIVWQEVDELPPTVRGEGGFGHTG